MHMVLVSDIFGCTAALKRVSQQLGDCTIVDPYHGVDMGFSDEQAAYDYFTLNIGLDAYLIQVRSALEKTKNIQMLIGFSMGASVIWRLSNEIINHNIQQAICFYGSQIRYFTNVKPTFNITVILPKSEAHFCVKQLTEKIIYKERITVKQVPYLHGFMNPCSTNFNKTGYMEQMNYLNSLCQ